MTTACRAVPGEWPARDGGRDPEDAGGAETGAAGAV